LRIGGSGLGVTVGIVQATEVAKRMVAISRSGEFGTCEPDGAVAETIGEGKRRMGG